MNHTNHGQAWRIVRSVLLVAMLAGCAGQQAHREGLELMAAGQTEAGLAKLTEATQAAPDNMTYRIDLVRNRDQTINGLLAAASSERAAGHADVAEAIYARILGIDRTTAVPNGLKSPNGQAPRRSITRLNKR
jgi:general secretion pathway protein D